MTVRKANTASAAPIATRFTLTGRLQGIGLRPAVARLAGQLNLVGYVANTRGGVVICVEGSCVNVERFERDLFTGLPAAAEVATCESVRMPLTIFDAFTIDGGKPRPLFTEPSDDSPTRVPLATFVPPDVMACAACLDEVCNSADSRYQYPFNSCTDCGPRFTITKRMPYERAETGMADFPLCVRCTQEYKSAADRRFHAQTITCSDCGPQTWLRDSQDRVLARKNDAIEAAAMAIRNGRILALRGLGGYQLLVDAESEAAVLRLRDRKRRHGKPFAVMAASVVQATRLAKLNDVERDLLRSPAGPIVVASAQSDNGLAESVCAGMRTIGVMLPTTPLHALLLQYVKRPVVCTSANIESAPLIYDDQAALSQLREIADVWLEHDRPIVRPIDDSVVRVINSRPVTLRLGRGYAPLPLAISTDQPLIALGGQQKAAFALSNSVQAVLGAHVGDLNAVAGRYVEQLQSLSELYEVDPARMICDEHPDYFTTQWAERQAVEITRVQHHHAHIVTGMFEHGWLDRQVLGVAFDGTGYGSDGSIWGGEFLLATVAGFERVGSLRPFLLPGSERAIREPWRIATALVREAAGESVAARLNFHSHNAESLLPLLRSPRLSPTTTSVGRLFDGVAALILGIEHCQFEGQAAMLLESACDLSATGEYEIPLNNSRLRQLDWRPLVRKILSERVAGKTAGEMAMRFHRGLANAVFQFCQTYSPLPVVLGGGVFQNRTLVELLAERFADGNQPLGTPGLIPPNDGGLAAGQLAIASNRGRKRRDRQCV